MRAVIHCNFDLCTGCSICQLACSQVKTGGTNPRAALLTITRNGLAFRPVVCAQCQNAFCMRVCPVEAIYHDSDSRVIIDGDKCTGCGLCVEACQEGMVFWDAENKKAVKCDLCGGEPACVAFCPTGALEKLVTGGNAGA